MMLQNDVAGLTTLFADGISPITHLINMWDYNCVQESYSDGSKISQIKWKDVCQGLLGSTFVMYALLISVIKK